MRSNEERIAVMYERAVKLKKIRNIQIVSFSAVLIATVFIAVSLSSIKIKDLGTVPSGMNASVFYETDHLLSIVIALVSFLLGISVTVLCFYIKKIYGREAQ